MNRYSSRIYLFFVLYAGIVFFISVIVESVNAENMSNTAKHTVHLAHESVCEKTLLHVLEDVQDPEIQINIIELGIVQSITCDTQSKMNTITIILTSPLCPYIRNLVESIKSKSKNAFPERDVHVVIDTETRWSPAFMSDTGRKRFWGRFK